MDRGRGSKGIVALDLAMPPTAVPFRQRGPILRRGLYTLPLTLEQAGSEESGKSTCGILKRVIYICSN